MFIGLYRAHLEQYVKADDDVFCVSHIEAMPSNETIKSNQIVK